eukprot:13358527-Ditylum_brightwellii.AAC.1
MPYFTETEGIEGLLFVEEQYRSAACQLQFSTGLELFGNFDEVLKDTAEEKWESLVSGIDEADKTPKRFDLEIGRFYR